MRRNTVKASTRLFEITGSRVISKLFEKSQLSKSRQKGPWKDLIPPSIKYFKFNKLWMCSLPLLPLAATWKKGNERLWELWPRMAPHTTRKSNVLYDRCCVFSDEKQPFPVREFYHSIFTKLTRVAEGAIGKLYSSFVIFRICPMLRPWMTVFFACCEYKKADT